MTKRIQAGRGLGSAVSRKSIASVSAKLSQDVGRSSTVDTSGRSRLIQKVRISQ